MEHSIHRVNRTREAARKSYNRLSRWYDLLAGSSEKKFREQGIKRLSAQPGETILEIGSGTGHCLVALARAVGTAGRVIGVDISDGMLAISRKRLQQEGLEDLVDLYQADATNLDFLSPVSVDGIFMSFTLELFDIPDITCVLQECRRVLRPGGRLAVVSMTKTESPGLAVRMYEWFHDHLPAYADCRPISARTSIEQNGFMVQDVSLSSMWGLPVSTVLAQKSAS